MGTVKMTFSLDETTASRLNETAESLRRPKSAVVREAILDYSERAGRLTESERRLLLGIFDDVLADIPDRPARTVDEELEEVRRSRGRAGRRRGGR